MTMDTPSRFPAPNAVLDPRIDDLLLRLRGLVLVGEVLGARGASSAEIEEHAREADRVRVELAHLLGEEGPGLAA
jgi:hypothetical protein